VTKWRERKIQKPSTLTTRYKKLNPSEKVRSKKGPRRQQWCTGKEKNAIGEKLHLALVGRKNKEEALGEWPVLAKRGSKNTGQEAGGWTMKGTVRRTGKSG